MLVLAAVTCMLNCCEKTCHPWSHNPICHSAAASSMEVPCLYLYMSRYAIAKCAIGLAPQAITKRQGGIEYGLSLFFKL